LFVAADGEQVAAEARVVPDHDNPAATTAREDKRGGGNQHAFAEGEIKVRQTVVKRVRDADRLGVEPESRARAPGTCPRA
jgi:hypothetical protein